MSLQRILALAYKEWREILRDRLFLGLAFLVPPYLMIIVGYGLVLDVENIPIVILDYDRSQLSREYAFKFIDSRYFDFNGYVDDEETAGSLLQDAEVRAAVIIPEHFQRRLLSGRSIAVQTLIDGTIPSRASTISGYVDAINAAFSIQTAARYISATHGIPAEDAVALAQPIRLKTRYLYNEALKSRWAIAPATLMMILALVPPILTAVGVVREKERGSINNIYSSTLTHAEFMLGKVIPYIVIAMLNVPFLWMMATVWLGAPFRGDPILYIAVTLLFVFCTTGLGLIVSLMVRTQIAAILITLVLSLVPTMLYSGMIIPTTSLSGGAAVQSHLLSATYFNRVTQSLFLKGVGLETIWPDVLALAIYSTVLFTIGYLMFSKRPRA